MRNVEVSSGYATWGFDPRIKYNSIEYRIRQGKSLFIIDDFGDKTAGAEIENSSRRIFKKNNVVYDAIAIHDVAPLNISHGAWVTQQQLSNETNAVCVTVVDPEVGTSRKPLAFVTKDNNTIIAPNNGVAYPAAREHGIEDIYELIPGEIKRLAGVKDVSKTFHGRDIFAPAGALAACGVDITRFAEPLSDKVKEFELQEKGLIHIDDFGNLKVNDKIPLEATYLQLKQEKSSKKKSDVNILIPVVEKFADVKIGNLSAYTGSSNCLEIAVRNGKASRALGVLGVQLEIGKPLNYEFGFGRGNGNGRH